MIIPVEIAKEFVVGKEIIQHTNYEIDLQICSILKAGLGGIIFKNTVQYNAIPTPLSIVEKDYKRFYYLHPGVYQLVFNQGIKKLPKGWIGCINPSQALSLCGGVLSYVPLSDSGAINNISAYLLVQDYPIQIELDSPIATLYFNGKLPYDTIEEE